jgi:hypothetical protein
MSPSGSQDDREAPIAFLTTLPRFGVAEGVTVYER